MHAKWVFILLFSLVLSSGSYFLWILWFSNFVYHYGKFSLLITFSLHSRKTSLKSSIQRSFASYSKIKTLKMIQNPVKSVKNLPPRVLWNQSQMRCCTFVPGSPLSPSNRSNSDDLAPAFVPRTKHWRRDGSTSASPWNSLNNEPNVFMQECTWVFMCRPCS